MTIRDLRNELNDLIENDGFGERELKEGFSIFDHVKDETRSFPIVDGDIFESGADIIAHQVNCQGVMGSGVAKQVRDKFQNVFRQYKSECEARGNSMLGECLMVWTEENDSPRVLIANLFGQDQFGYDGKCYTNYSALRTALSTLRVVAQSDLIPFWHNNPKIAIPYLMGCHRGGGDWEIVSKMIEEELAGCDVTYYRYTAG